MESLSRNFKGIWIPAHIWLDQRLTYFERCLLAELHSLDGEEGCFASNEYLAKFFNERERKIQEGIAKLKELGYVYQKSFDGRTRVLKTRLEVENDKSLFSTSDVRNSAPLKCENPHPSHNIYNKEENKGVVCGDAKKNSFEIIHKLPSGQEKKITESEIFKHFVKLPYKTEIVQQAIEIAKKKAETEPIGNILKYLEGICLKLATEKPKSAKYEKPKQEFGKHVPKDTSPGVLFGDLLKRDKMKDKKNE